MIKRQQLETSIKEALGRSRVVALVGPRQCGKTTMAREFISPDSMNYFDLEDPVSLSRLDEPMTGLKDLKGLVVIDEIQRKPELFPVLRVLADRIPLPARFLILGSASPELLHRSSESLAGRVERIEMSGLSLEESGFKYENHWLRGGLPLSYLAGNDADSVMWRKNYIQTVAERDIHLLGFSIPSTTLLRFWTMLSHYHGQLWNASELAKSLGVGHTTVRRYLDLLTDIFMIRQLQPWHANLKKRQIKSPKIYFRDSGLLHELLGIRTVNDLLTHPKCGASWEGYIIEEIIRTYHPDDVYFWATHNSAEIDLLLQSNGQTIGVECKRADAPKITPSIRIALDDLKLAAVYIVYPGMKSYSLAENVYTVSMHEMVSFFRDVSGFRI